MWLFPNYNHVRSVGRPVHAMVGWVVFGLAVGGWCHFVICVGETHGHIMSKSFQEIQKLT